MRHEALRAYPFEVFFYPKVIVYSVAYSTSFQKSLILFPVMLTFSVIMLSLFILTATFFTSDVCQ